MYPAKSPMGMFDDTLIPNDLNAVCETIDAYYAEDVVVPTTTSKKSK
jgi:hypothetical protein